MRKYSIYKLQGDEILQKHVASNRATADKYIAIESESGLTLLVSNYVLDNGEKRLFRVDAYLFGDKVHTYRKMPTIDDLTQLLESLPVILKPDGTKSYLPNMDLTTPKSIEILGGFGHCRIVSDELPRMAIVYRDVDELPKNKLPRYNKFASERFGLELYGNVIYIKENYI